MELPIPVMIHNELLGLKGASGSLMQISPDGFYMVTASFGDKVHKVLLPIGQTVLIFEEPEETAGETLEIER